MTRKAAPKSVFGSGCSAGATGVLDTWQKIIQDYQDNHSGFRKAEKDYFGSLSLDAAIKQAALCRTHKDRRHPHQCRLKQETLDEFYTFLREKRKRIGACNSFDDLFSLVEEARMKGIGELTIYDVAHRISIKKELLPQKVYLHNGTRAGVLALNKAFGLHLDHKAKTLEMHELPEPLRHVTAEEAEDILCIYKDKFSTLR